MHRGHQQLLAEVVDLSAAHGLQSLVYTFDCPPEQWFSQQLQLLTDLAAKERLILGHGIDKIITTRFSKEFAGISARSFVVDVLLEQLRAKLVVCGFNFRFGHGAEGEAAYLQALGEQYGFIVRIIPPVLHGGEPISSSRIRRAVQAGDLDLAAELLGRRHAYTGTVIPGKRLGRKLGFPTANLAINHELVLPKAGAYLTWCFLSDGTNYPAMTSVSPNRNIESHLFGFDGNLYQQPIEIQFLVKFRDWLFFANESELQRQLSEDYAQARALLGKYRLQGHEIVLK
ncbi:MAG: riboflavin biosynthesis protein RibF [Firmicutes bacterium]|nr:riboflavin biosynthesis protein RibF [Bacillota bacterium]